MKSLYTRTQLAYPEWTPSFKTGVCNKCSEQKHGCVTLAKQVYNYVTECDRRFAVQLCGLTSRRTCEMVYKNSLACPTNQAFTYETLSFLVIFGQNERKILRHKSACKRRETTFSIITFGPERRHKMTKLLCDKHTKEVTSKKKEKKHVDYKFKK